MRYLFILSTILFTTVLVHAQEPYVLHAPVLSAEPKIDGRLDDPVWQEAMEIDTFIQVEPEEGSPSTESTVVLIGYDQKKLYIAARCDYKEPGKVVSVVLDRDGRLYDEDSFQVVFDTFADGQNGFLFVVNPLGAQFDALVRNEGDDVNYAWDSLWLSATSRTETGWVAEIAIPFRALRFPKAASQSWGFNIQRTIIHRRETVLWKPVPRVTAGSSLLKVSQAGKLVGLAGIEPGRSLDFKPYVLGRIDRRSGTADESDFEAGIDVKKSLSTDLTLDLTYNLDFAEAEADSQQLNLTRFPLFFPEQRDFFLEGANLFYFGERPDFLKTPDKIFFFSRRIGLTEDGEQQVQVLGGAKISGRAGRYSIGFLNLTTDEHRYGDRDGVERFEAQTNYTVARLKRDILEKSAIGFMYLRKDVESGPATSGAGFDWDLAFGKFLKTGGFVAETETPGRAADEWAGSMDVVWQSPKVFSKLTYTEVGEDFNPEMGFFSRLGIKEWRGLFVYHVTKKEKKVRDIYYYDEFTRVTDRKGNVETQLNRLEMDMIWHTQAGIFVKVFDHVEALPFSFEIRPGVVIPPGRYDFTHYFFGAQTVPSRPVFAFIRLDAGEFYDGDFQDVVVGARLRPIRGFNTIVSYERNDVDFPAGDFTDELVSINGVYAPSPWISIRALIEWRGDDNFSTKATFKWEYRPGSTFYLVYDEFRDLRDRPFGALALRERALISKVTFSF